MGSSGFCAGGGLSLQRVYSSLLLPIGGVHEFDAFAKVTITSPLILR